MAVLPSEIQNKEPFCISLDSYKLESKKIYEIGGRKFVRGIWRK
ncbi:hypothetical protein [Clostridium sp. BL8]|nr:hypothetical protein [Clostridium sp. BL8]